jgi:predicted nucleic acid-binding Zn finger protein
MNIQREGDHFIVSSKSGRKYEVYPDRPFCTCPDFLFRCLKKEGSVCKHVEAARGIE